MTRTARGFRPPWWATLGTLLLGGLFVAAGAWQLGRAGEKRELFARFDAGATGPVIAAPATGTDVDRLRYAAVALAGHFDSAHQVLLDARTRDGRAGYEVLTPLLRAAPDDGPAVLVNRGWLPADSDRSRLPDVIVAPGPRRVTGLIDRLPRAALAAGDAAADAGAGWPRRMLFPTSAGVAVALGYPVVDYQVLLSPGAPDGYRRDWRPALMTPQQHVAYAVQWFAMAAALVVLYVALNLRKARVPATRT